MRVEGVDGRVKGNEPFLRQWPAGIRWRFDGADQVLSIEGKTTPARFFHEREVAAHVENREQHHREQDFARQLHVLRPQLITTVAYGKAGVVGAAAMFYTLISLA